MRIKKLLNKHAKAFAPVNAEEIRFDPAFGALCEQNACGFYGACWMCPPDVGEISVWIAKARSYDHAIVFQTVREIEDSYDIEAMRRAARAHNRLIERMRHAAEQSNIDCLLLGAGACGGCKDCAKKEGKPCRHPDRATVPLEAAGVDVTQLSKLSGLTNINCKNTVTYFGLLLYRGDLEA